MAGAVVFSVEELLSLTVTTPSLILRLALAYVNRLRDRFVRFVTSQTTTESTAYGSQEIGARGSQPLLR
jgi:hypothetical protein